MIAPPRGIWLRASRVLNRPVPVREPYPHLCGSLYPPRPRTRPRRVRRRDCPACVEQWPTSRTDLHRHPFHTGGLGCCPLPEGHWVHDVTDYTDEQRVLDARRTGDH